jgi:DNA-directed RNA polymerase specialized sigma24 family protein
MTLNQEALDQLLLAFDSDREVAGTKYRETHRDLIRFFEWRGCPYPEDHADETINRVAKRILDGEVVRELSKYFFGVARLLVLEIRKDRAKQLAALDHPPTDISLDEPARALLDCLDQCLDQMPANQRDLIITYYHGEKSVKVKNRRSLSASLGISTNTLRMRALRLRAILESCVELCVGK